MGNITFAKVMIFLCLVGSGYLAYVDWQQYQQIKQLKEDLRPLGKVELLVRETQKLGKQYAELTKSLSNDDLAGQASPLTYISEIADYPKIAIGDVSIQTSEKNPGIKGLVDKVYAISPQPSKRDFPKLRIANFLFKLEDKSPRIRVTRLVIDQLNKAGKPKVEPTEYPKDSYYFSAEVTSREKEEQ